MSVQLYTGSLSLVRRSGVGQAVLHQRAMLEAAGVPVTDRSSPAVQTVHINTVLPDAPAAALAARLSGKKVVYYGHSTQEDFRASFKGSDLLSPLFRSWIKFCYSLGDVIITPTPYSRQLLLSYGIRWPIHTLTNGVDTDFFAPSPERRRAFRKKYGLTAEQPAVLSVGHCIARKGLPEFVELARKLPHVRFFWFGWTNPCLIPKAVRQAIASAPANLTFPGFVSREELRDAYCGCDVFAFMSHEETEGIVVLEALACGIPTVVRDILVYRDWLTDGVNVCKAKDDWSFLRKVTGLLDGTVPSPAPGGRQTALRHSIAVAGQSLRRIYDSEGLPYSQPEPSLRAVGLPASR